jgi:hypothetical protein
MGSDASKVHNLPFVLQDMMVSDAHYSQTPCNEITSYLVSRIRYTVPYTLLHHSTSRSERVCSDAILSPHRMQTHDADIVDTRSDACADSSPPLYWQDLNTSNFSYPCSNLPSLILPNAHISHLTTAFFISQSPPCSGRRS